MFGDAKYRCICPQLESRHNHTDFVKTVVIEILASLTRLDRTCFVSGCLKYCVGHDKTRKFRVGPTTFCHREMRRGRIVLDDICEIDGFMELNKRDIDLEPSIPGACPIRNLDSIQGY